VHSDQDDLGVEEEFRELPTGYPLGVYVVRGGGGANRGIKTEHLLHVDTIRSAMTIHALWTRFSRPWQIMCLCLGLC
jgi:hypothetical protein